MGTEVQSVAVVTHHDVGGCCRDRNTTATALPVSPRNAFETPWPPASGASMMEPMTLETTTSAPELLRHAYEQMVLVRAFETEAERQYKADHIGGYCHVASGQEAVI